MRTRRLALVLFALNLLALPAPARADGDSNQELTVMTRNLYVGSSYEHALSATSPAGFVEGVSTIWANVRHSNFPARAEAIADEIAAKRPDVVGLQEVSLFRRSVGSEPPEVAFDYLAILLDELASRGVAYTPATVSTGFDVTVPAIEDGQFVNLQLTDRDAILVRSGGGALEISSAESAQFAARLIQPSAVGPIPLPRTWNRIDGTYRGQQFRVVNTHLEPDPGVQVEQARELLAGPLASSRPLIALGDFNSPADGGGTATYGLLASGGLGDAWGGSVGTTCCQAELLDNPVSQLSERIDLVLTANGVRAKEAERVGQQARDRIAGLWPSDHAGVVAELKLASRR
jgi:endonuclease/exonuclease/phosphatase family metal-dependent hydrolase